MKLLLPKVNHTLSGYQVLTRLYLQTKECIFDRIEIDMKSTTWFDADMCAVLGAILYYLNAKLNTVELTNIQIDVSRILRRNGFLSHYGGEELPDRFNTTMPYQRFETTDRHAFASYIEHELRFPGRLPTMSRQLLVKFFQNIIEIFDNAATHSQSVLGVFSCGQRFSQKNRMFFTVVDLGVGIRANIASHLGQDLSSTDAISWAIQKHHSTRRKEMLGGLGFTLLLEFIELNGGSVQIVSDDGYWRKSEKQVLSRKLYHPFPGTAITVEINTADTSSYALPSEIQSGSIF